MHSFDSTFDPALQPALVAVENATHPYEMRLRLGSEHVTLFGALRASTLFQLLQQASIAHTDALGVGDDKTRAQGLMWVLTRQQSRILRMPRYKEDITVRTWPGKTLHGLFVRYYSVSAASGEPLISASALWALVDIHARKLVIPEPYGIFVAPIVTGDELPLPAAPVSLPAESTFQLAVPFSYVDLNGHLNNARYLDLAEDHAPAAAEGRELMEIRIEYASEARLGATLTVHCGNQDGQYYFCGSTDKTCFRMNLLYR